MRQNAIATCATVLLAGAAVLARADFSFTITQKSAGGPAASAVPVPVTKQFPKGQKMKVETGETVTILDFDAQTFTTLNTRQKTWSVTPFSELRERYNASQLILTMTVDSPQSERAAMKMQMEVEMWLTSEVPAAPELRAFYQKNADRFPWAALAGGDAGMRSAMAEMQKKVASLGGVPVLQVVRAKPAGNAAQAAQAQQGMAEAEPSLRNWSGREDPAPKWPSRHSRAWAGLRDPAPCSR